MLRLYTPIKHDIFTLHTLLEKVVCDVWCTANTDSCDGKLEKAFKNIYNYSYKSTPKVKKTLKDEVERIYEKFKNFNQHQKNLIKASFKVSNSIEELCKGTILSYNKELPLDVHNDIKDLFKWCYENLLEKGKVAGDKMEYYNQLIKHPDNDYNVCPCCGLIDIESSESICREDYDHYLPKSNYPFASVNFLNLIPICKKCNQDRKKAKDPIEKGRVAFYPFSSERHNIEINLNYIADINKTDKELNFQDLNIILSGQKDKIETWDWLFDIVTRYEDNVKTFSKRFLKEIKRRHDRFQKFDSSWTYLNTLNELIDDYQYDYYDEKKFLKIAFLKAIKNDSKFKAVYE
ncbi:hypothetical protein DSM03_103149 [Leeuwenhoekiella aestuarii]|uniref:HNH endonuclease n=1 Tax=Leeuwenhoekiella aestuarii TaxID=2249426 RepID=A0A4Q0NXL5_9FLAO|nr:hypothetical protein [Leeuwenhoekiella aestuarii]RXG15964.1 hypothetical protein DSM03_103149 [Leeuwenhoekiella aestuarii]RXG16658.1 hypothetical protein DSM04_102239 [Leeuwenhoekiella aestuarii]